jgi:hypothetical protein
LTGTVVRVRGACDRTGLWDIEKFHRDSLC